MMPPPPIPKKPNLQAPSKPAAGRVSFLQIAKSFGHRILLYGTGGIGKTTLTCRAPGRVALVDADDSLPVLKSNLVDQGIDLPAIVPVSDFSSLRATLQMPGWEGIGTIGVDITKVQEWAEAFMLKTVPNDKGKKVYRIEDFGYGKGYQHLFDVFLPLLSDLDRHCKEGRNVILVAHDCVKSVPNPQGEDWIRYEPRLSDPKSGLGSIKLRVKEWADHVLFMGYDIAVSEEKKATGSGTKTLYTSELPNFMAKSRTTSQQFVISDGAGVWEQIIK